LTLVKYAFDGERIVITGTHVIRPGRPVGAFVDTDFGLGRR
jgi:hypothetical protein